MGRTVGVCKKALPRALRRVLWAGLNILGSRSGSTLDRGG
ncbi:hypothetical protein HMPREF1556_01426 [Porphyromonas sp. oral taxon 278 str. W7784]|nr:hypothetical protein HMPREF1556_01426 [Porphyromonas sp. oral taxon 278 str. W7784]